MVALQRAGEAVPPAVEARALIDTGATSTSVNPTIVSQLALAPRGYTSVITSTTGTTPQVMEQYDVALLLRVEGTVHYLTQALPVIGMRPLPAVDVLIGRDVLNNCTLIYDGKRGECRLIMSD
jgi:hypothetical protein